MHRIKKLWWGLRAVALKPFFGSIGLPSYIGPTLFVQGSRRIFLGKKVRIFPGLRAEAHGSGRIYIHDDVAIEQDFHIIAGNDLHIEEGTLISASVFVSDLDHEYEDVTRPVHEQGLRQDTTRIGRNCFIGFGARIQAGTILGDGCVVGSNAVLRGEYPPHSVIVGAPGRVVKQFNPETNEWERVTR